ncbi:MAG: methyltransferase domain-containing protein [Anaerolinea sp.]|nr:methyltransferase domain-containing protein [Anaerolinea sp.]
MPSRIDKANERPWQLEMFGRSLKKQQKLDALLKLAGNVTDQDCLLLTCGDNNGALNYYFREHGGRWAWGDVIGENLDEMSALLGETVHHVPEAAFPLADSQFDCVVAIDVLEHLADDQPFLSEVRRVLRPGGRGVITVPNGDPRLLANRLKWRVGMTPEIYGHTRAGYTVPELQAALRQAGFQPTASGGYSRLFTELIELVINFGYVRVLSRQKGQPEPGHIAPTSSGDLKRHGAAYRLYTLAFPLMRLFSKLDWLLPASGNGAVIVVANKPEGTP